MNIVSKFVLWFSCSLVGTFFLDIFIPNRFLLAVAVALIISVIATKEEGF